MSRPEGSRTEHRAEETGAELAPALTVAAHDVTEAVRVVTGYLELLGAQAEGKLDEPAQRYLGGVRDGIGHLDRLVHGVLTLVRASVEPLDLEDVETDLSLEDAMRPLRDQLAARGARVKTGELPVIRADAGRTRDLLRILVSNALVFASDEPLIVEVGAVRERAGWRFSVRDNGSGVPEDALERVLEPFERAHPRSIATGPGLGLAIGQRIVERRGGRLWLTTGGRGTTATFTVPDQVPEP